MKEGGCLWFSVQVGLPMALVGGGCAVVSGLVTLPDISPDQRPNFSAPRWEAPPPPTPLPLPTPVPQEQLPAVPDNCLSFEQANAELASFQREQGGQSVTISWKDGRQSTTVYSCVTFLAEEKSPGERSCDIYIAGRFLPNGNICQIRP